MTDTHMYDGKLVSVEDVNSNVDKKIYLRSFYTDLKISPEGKRFLDQILNDVGTSANFDPTNKLSADVLLCRLVKHLGSTEFLSELDLQLKDMATGFCPQGRTHRLYQLFLAFED